MLLIFSSRPVPSQRNRIAHEFPSVFVHFGLELLQTLSGKHCRDVLDHSQFPTRSGCGCIGQERLRHPCLIAVSTLSELATRKNAERKGTLKKVHLLILLRQLKPLSTMSTGIFAYIHTSTYTYRSAYAYTHTSLMHCRVTAQKQHIAVFSQIFTQNCFSQHLRILTVQRCMCSFVGGISTPLQPVYRTHQHVGGERGEERHR